MQRAVVAGGKDGWVDEIERTRRDAGRIVGDACRTAAVVGVLVREADDVSGADRQRAGMSVAGGQRHASGKDARVGARLQQDGFHFAAGAADAHGGFFDSRRILIEVQVAQAEAGCLCGVRLVRRVLDFRAAAGAEQVAGDGHSVTLFAARVESQRAQVGGRHADSVHARLRVFDVHDLPGIDVVGRERRQGRRAAKVVGGQIVAGINCAVRTGHGEVEVIHQCAGQWRARVVAPGQGDLQRFAGEGASVADDDGKRSRLAGGCKAAAAVQGVLVM